MKIKEWVRQIKLLIFYWKAKRAYTKACRVLEEEREMIKEIEKRMNGVGH